MVGLEMKQETKRKEIKKLGICLIFLVLFLISFFIRFFPVRTGFHYWDECVYLQHAEIIAGDRSESLFNEFDIRPPLLPLFIAGIYQFSHSLIAAHFIVALISSLGIILIFLVGKELFNDKVAILSALIFSLIPLNIQMSHDIMVDAILPTLWLATCLFNIYALKRNKLLFYFLTGVLLGLSVLLKFSSLSLLVIVPITFLIYNFNEVKLKKFKILYDKRLIIFLIGTLLVLFPYLYWVQVKFGFFLYTIILGAAVVNWDTPTNWPIFFKNLQGLLPLSFFIGILFLIGILIKNKMTNQKNLKEMLFIFSYLFVPILLISNLNHLEVRFLLPITPFLTLFAALGFIIIAEIKKLKKFLISIIVMAIILSVFAVINIWSIQELSKGNFILNGNKPAIMEASLWLRSNTEEGDILYANHQWPVIAYYSARPTIVLPLSEKFQDRIEEFMLNDGYLILPSSSPKKEPSLDFLLKDRRFNLIKTFEDSEEKVYIFNYARNILINKSGN